MSEESRDSSPDARVLRHLVKEYEAETPPQLDWDQLESRLFASLDSAAPRVRSEANGERESLLDVAELGRKSVTPAAQVQDRPSLFAAQAKAKKPPVYVYAAAAFLAAAGIFGLLAVRYRSLQQPVATFAVKEVVDPASIPEAPGMSGYRELGALKSGDIVEASVGAVAFGQQGAVEWTLAAGSRLVVKTPMGAENVHVVELDSGSVKGRVHEQSSVRFVVTAGETEVVSFSEGAVFTVTRSSKRIVVHMEEGVATVGKRDSAEQPHRIEAPVHAALALDGVSGFEIVPTETVEASTAPKSAATTMDAAPDVAATTVKPSLPEAPSPPASKTSAPSATTGSPAVETPVVKRGSLSAATASVMACMNQARAKQREESKSDVKVTVSSTLKVSVDADGKVKGLSFSPPLPPALQNCGVSLFGTTFEPGERTELIPVQLQ